MRIVAGSPMNAKVLRGKIAFLDPSGIDANAFQSYDDDKSRSQRTRMEAVGKDFRARTLIGSFDDHADTLARLNNDGCAVHVTINYIEGRARIEKNVERVRK